MHPPLKSTCKNFSVIEVGATFVVTTTIKAKFIVSPPELFWIVIHIYTIYIYYIHNHTKVHNC